MGSLEFNSATYYRYISLDLGQLYANLFDDDPCDAERVNYMQGAVEAFTKALYLAVPAARQTTQSGASFWDYAHVLFRKGQRLQASFDAPVLAKGGGYLEPSIGGYLEPSIQALENFLRKKEQEAGSLFQKQGEIRFGAGIEKSGDVDKCSVDEILASLKDMLQKAKP
jgi:CRISPR system Cascade subunit CasC